MSSRKVKQIRRPCLAVLLFSAWLWPTMLSAQVEMTLVSTAPERAHLVRPGTPTTFVVEVRNTSLAESTACIAIEAASEDQDNWEAVLFLADDLFRPVGAPAADHCCTLGAGDSKRLLAALIPAPALPDDDEGVAIISLSSGAATLDTLAVRGKVRDRPKIYYVALDGAGSDYLRIDRKGLWYNGENEPLMPRAAEFLEQGALLVKAEAVLPSSTDGNHGAALTGSWPGTLGIFSVKTHYLGMDENDHPVTSDGSRELLRWGQEGSSIRSVFDVVKDPAAGGAADVFSVLISGKKWLADLVYDDVHTVDIVASGFKHPDYVPDPPRYRLGDPPSDPDAATDRDGTNLGPRSLKKLFSLPAVYAGTNPRKTPEDRWVAEAVIRMIAAEDPDLLYANLSQCDTMQHIYGSADNPDEWRDRHTPDILWDDTNIYNRNANRDPALDMVYEADQSFGLIQDVLQLRGTLDLSYVILLSDHGQTTVMNTRDSVLEIGRILAESGVDPAVVERMVTSGGFGWIALADPTAAPTIEMILENFEIQHPVFDSPVKPFFVINRDEMDLGIDNDEGPVGGDGIAGNLRGFLYSEWAIDHPVSDFSKVRWPDLYVFNRFHFQNSLVRTNALDHGLGSLFHGHHGSVLSKNVILGMRGPGIEPGSYFTDVTLADIVPTLYLLLGLELPDHVDGRVLEEILAPSGRAHAPTSRRAPRFPRAQAASSPVPPLRSER